MNIILGEKEVPIIAVVGRGETINDARRDIIELWTDEPLTAEDIEYIKTHDSFTNDMGGTYNNYKEVVRYSTWLAQVDANAAIVEEKNAIIAEKETAIQAITAEKEEAETKIATVRSSINVALFDRRDDILVELLELMEEWDENGTYVRGDNRKWNGNPYTAIQPSSPNGDMNYAPDKAAALWSIYHAKSFKHALPWVAPTH